MTRLKRRGYYEASATQNAQVSADGMAVDLTLDFRPGPVVTVTYEGDRLPAERLKELVPIEREGTVDEDLLEDSAQAIKAHLNQQGYWKADATWRRQESDGKLTIAFRITAGRQYHVADIELTGNSAVTSDDIRLLLGMKPGDLFMESKLTNGVAAVTVRYRRQGFSQVRDQDRPRPTRVTGWSRRFSSWSRGRGRWSAPSRLPGARRSRRSRSVRA